MTPYKPPTVKKKWGADRTMVNIKRSTKSELEKIGDMRNSFDDVVMRLVKFWNENH
jgi:hypothetical protein